MHNGLLCFGITEIINNGSSKQLKVQMCLHKQTRTREPARGDVDTDREKIENAWSKKYTREREYKGKQERQESLLLAQDSIQQTTRDKRPQEVPTDWGQHDLTSESKTDDKQRCCYPKNVGGRSRITRPTFLTNNRICGRYEKWDTLYHLYPGETTYSWSH